MKWHVSHCTYGHELSQDCPGKATHTVLLACVTAADICHEQTLQTLRFAERARLRNLPGALPLPMPLAPYMRDSVVPLYGLLCI